MRERTAFSVSRRQFLEMLGVGAALWMTSPLLSLSKPPPSLAAVSRYRVGVGALADPYDATLRAVQASGEWPAAAIAGQTVVIKPNLVTGQAADTGATTDPQVTRALVDLALESDPVQVLIVESGGRGANFSATGYDFFASYHPRVALIDLADWPIGLFPVAGGMAYRWLYMPRPLMDPNTVFISAAKMKTHVEALATLSMKNLFGLPALQPYREPGSRSLGRFGMHNRSVSQTIIDLNLARPIHFAVVDGVWAMEGRGPIGGSPVKMDMVVAGSNPLAVDQVCLEAMVIPQDAVHHVWYAVAKGFGPPDTSAIDVVGDPVPSHVFELPYIPPVVYMPQFEPHIFSPNSGQSTNITYWLDRDSSTRVEVVRTSDGRPWWEQHIRTLHDWTEVLTGEQVLTWDGRDDKGDIVPRGRYAIRIQAHAPLWTPRDSFAINWVIVAK